MSAKLVAQKRACGHVGDFYNHLGAGIIGGEVNGDVHDNSAPAFGDVYNSRLKISLEAKGANSAHGWRMSKWQMDLYSNNGWKYVYLLGGYTDDQNSKTPRYVLSTLKTRRTQFKFLASRTNQAWIVDLPFIQLLESLKMGVYHPNGAFGKDRNGGPDYELRRWQMQQFISPSPEELRSLGIVPHKWVFRTFEDFEKRLSIRPKKRSVYDAGRVEHYVSTRKFTLHTILSPRVDRLLAREIERNNDSGIPF